MRQIFCVGPPRCGGQTLQHAITKLVGKPMAHSVGDWSQYDHEKYTGAVEVWAPVLWLDYVFPGSLFILNLRKKGDWLRSAEKMYRHSAHWNNPMWHNHPTALPYVFDQYIDTTISNLSKLKTEWMTINVTTSENMCRMSQFLGLPECDEPFPFIDRVAERHGEKNG